MENIGVIGCGEIGSALVKIYKKRSYDVKIVDPKLQIFDKITDCFILNICIPYSEKFADIVNSYIDEINPKLTVVHSTVSPGTTGKIKGLVCHSPVRGLHPNLDTGIETFVKYIGSDNEEAAKMYSEHLTSLNIPHYVCKNSKTSEYAKLLDTSYYGLCIAFHAEVQQLCDKNNLDFDEVMTVYNSTYNSGYTSLGKHNVVRPVLYSTEKIGGHCVVPNIKLLKEHIDQAFVDCILKFE